MSTASSKPPLLEARQIAKDFPGVCALGGVTFALAAGEVHALCGENGAGKSTLIKVLSGVHPRGSYGGDVLLDGRPARFDGVRDAERAGIAVIYQELALVPHMTVGENVMLGHEPRRAGLVDHDRLYAEAEAVIARLGVSVDARVEVASLGVGMQQLVEIAKALRKRSRILILDEPTAALAEHEMEALFRIVKALKGQGTGLIYISHKLDEVFRIADRVTVLRDGRTVDSRSVGQWTRGEVVRAMVGRELGELFPRVEHEPGEVVLEVRGLCVRDPDNQARLRVRNVSFEVRRGEILGIAGLVGSGRTELVSAIFGALPGHCTGRVRVAGAEVSIRSPADAKAAGMALVPEDRKGQGLAPLFTVCENLSMAHLRAYCRWGVVDGERELLAARRTARELGIRAPSLDAPVETLSGGNQQKTVLGKWLMRPPRILFLDEPTRGIDVGAKAEIHRLIGELTRRGMAVVMVSSELPEVLGVADRVLVLREGAAAGMFDRREASPERVMEAATG